MFSFGFRAFPPKIWMASGLFEGARYYIDEKPDRFIVYFEMPGVKKEDIELYVNEAGVMVRAKVGDEYRELICRDYYLRRIRLPSDIEPDKVTSKYDSGILKVELPKRMAGKRIAIE